MGALIKEHLGAEIEHPGEGKGGKTPFLPFHLIISPEML